MCGILGVWSPLGFTQKTFIRWLRTLRHRGQETAGILWEGERLSWWNPSHSMPIDNEDRIVKGGLGHARYSTSGVKDVGTEGNVQPLVAEVGGGIVALVHNGNVSALEPDPRKTDSVLLWEWILHHYKTSNSWPQTLTHLISTFHGAFSIVIQTPEGVYVVRDRHGVRPLWIAFDSTTGTHLVSSETCAFPDRWRDVPPREVKPGDLLFTDLTIPWKRLWRFQTKVPKRFCSFEWIYFQHHTSSSVYGKRFELGEALALDEDQVMDLANPDTLVACMPRTAIPMAAGFADALGLTFVEEAIQKAPSCERTFIMASAKERTEAFKAKFVLDENALRGKVVFLVDDSLVRGSTMQAMLARLNGLGVAKIHVRIASPPVANSCDKGIDIPTKEELFWSKEDKSSIETQCASLRYLSVERMVGVVGRGSCTYCFTGVQAWADEF